VFSLDIAFYRTRRVTLDGTKIKANAGGNTSAVKEKLEAHLTLAREEKKTKLREAAMLRATRHRISRLEAAHRQVERLQREKKHDRGQFTASVSSTDPEARVMRNGEGGHRAANLLIFGLKFSRRRALRLPAFYSDA
jgi:hypothetical protein